uniref:Uncharacterized protein n=1 Tax=Amphiprion percula TaxID=161767 RepID=A0A3P8SY02_AMPPE
KGSSSAPFHLENSRQTIFSISFFTTSQKTMGPPRQTLQILQQSAVNKDLGARQVSSGKLNSKRKNWTAEQTRGTKRVKVEVKSTQTEEADCLPDGNPMKQTPPSAYWEELAEERRKALYNVLQENEKVKLQELAQHVQYMADMIERLTGRGPDNLEELKELALDVEKDNELKTTMKRLIRDSKRRLITVKVMQVRSKRQTTNKQDPQESRTNFQL